MDDIQTVPNPADPTTPSVVPVAATPVPPVTFAGFPKMRFHPVLGRSVAVDPNELAALDYQAGWRDTPEEADQNRTATEAQEVAFRNMMAKMAEHEAAGHVVVRNSVQADESLRRGNAEPL